jgi:glyoxylase-like metal-dependent hydrolase (beta-lactamase superfamily II)
VMFSVKGEPVEYSTQKVSQGVFLVRGRNNGRFPSSCSIVIRAARTALIDAGCGAEVLAGIAGEWNPDLVILSHGHPDHCSGAHLFPRERLWCPRESIGTTGNLVSMAERYVSSDLKEEWMAFVKKEMGFDNFTSGNSFGSGHRFDLGGLGVEAIHCPGHAEDHYCFHLPEVGVILSTDIDLSSFGPWYANEESDIDKFRESIGRLKSCRPACVVSAHMGVIRRGVGDRFERFLQAFDERDARILGSLNRPMSIEELVDCALIYRKYPKNFRLLRGWESTMLKKHLDRLVDRGLVRREGDKYMKCIGYRGRG